MKKYFTMALIAAAWLFAGNASAQVQFGLKGGLNVTSMSFSEEVLDASNRAGFFIGPTVKFTLPIVGLSMDASALYDQRSAKVEGVESGDQTLKEQAINIPINVRYGIGLSSLANLYFFAGPQFGFNVGNKDFQWNSTSSYQNTFQLKKSNFSVNLGAGVTLLRHLQISANYNIACGKTGEATVWNAIEAAEKQIVKGRANAWQVAVAYYF